MNNELERMWKEAVVVKFEAILHHVSEGTEENHDTFIRISSLEAEI
jgi:CO dehydrogenase nickel-insertion accessory protein CooC1